jgi:undecaprenyl-diphosphatase
MWFDLLEKITHLGDTMVLLLCGVALFFYLLGAEERRFLARRWAVAFGLCILLTILSKFTLHFVRWNEVSSLRMLSPSGHVAIGTCFYGCCAIMLSGGRSRAVCLLLWFSTLTLLGMIAASRLTLGLHSVPEVLVAFVIGAVSVVVFTRHLGDRQSIKLNAGQIIFLVLLIFVARYLPPINAEGLIEHTVRKLDSWPVLSRGG